jgi:nicotinate-nucleotide--dimethylbenzimidazole phosphoribosyltransferase
VSVSPRGVIEHVIRSISPASEANAARVRDRLGAAADGSLAALAVRLAAARHAPRPRVDRKAVVVVMADHGVADPGIDLGAAHPTAVAAAAIADGSAALVDVARRAGAKVLLVDAGATGPVPASAVGVGRGPALDVTRGAAMTPVDTVLAVEAGIAVAVALADDGLDVLALGAIGLGAEVGSAALVAALAGAPVTAVARPDDHAAVTAALAANPVAGLAPLSILGALGGGDHAVLTGLVLAAASMDVPVVLDDHATSAAALVAAALAPAVAGYLIAAHGGTQPSHRRALAALGLTPLFELGLSRGEGTGAALALPLVDGAAKLVTP